MNGPYERPLHDSEGITFILQIYFASTSFPTLGIVVEVRVTANPYVHFILDQKSKKW